ncbi:MAG: SDR family oxidoreductase [Gemmatimonadales bacterium]
MGDRSSQAKRIPLRREGTIEDCAKVVEFLVTDLSDYVTGRTIAIDGGLYRGYPRNNGMVTARRRLTASGKARHNGFRNAYPFAPMRITVGIRSPARRINIPRRVSGRPERCRNKIER